MAADAMGSLSAGAYRKPGTNTSDRGYVSQDKPPKPANTIINVNELTEVYDAHDAENVSQVVKSGFSHTDPEPNQPNKMEFGRDPYAHQGMPSEKYLANSGVDHKDDPVSDGGPAVLD